MKQNPLSFSVSMQGKKGNLQAMNDLILTGILTTIKKVHTLTKSIELEKPKY